MNIKQEQIQSMIYEIRGLKVMLDSDLAKLYDVKTKVLNQAVKRNLRRFPEDFMFKLSIDEYEILRSQIVTSSTIHGGRRYQPFVFTENGIAMLSSVLNSEVAIDVNISIMRVFTKLRSFYILEKDLIHRMDTIESNSIKIFKVVFERLDNLEKFENKKNNRKKIGLK